MAVHDCPSCTCPPVAEPKRGVEEIVLGVAIELEDLDSTPFALLGTELREAMRLYREERDGRK